MENKNYKILGVIFLCEFALMLLLLLLFFGLFLLNSGMVLLNSSDSKGFVPIFLIYAAIIVFYIIFMIPFGVGGWKLFKNKNGAKGWGVAASICSLLFFFPFGLIIGILGFVFLFSENKNAMNRNPYAQPQNYNPPPPNQNWQ